MSMQPSYKHRYSRKKIGQCMFRYPLFDKLQFLHYRRNVLYLLKCGTTASLYIKTITSILLPRD